MIWEHTWWRPVGRGLAKVHRHRRGLFVAILAVIFLNYFQRKMCDHSRAESWRTMISD